jgi:hypothetical protein
VNNIQREVTWNLNVGAQYRLFDKYPLRAGLFTNNSSAPSIDQGTEPQLANIGLYGGTLGLTLPGKYTETTLGAMFSFGSGQAKTPITGSSVTELLYAPGPSNQFFVDVFLGGSYQF